MFRQTEHLHTNQMYDMSWVDSYLISEPGMLNVWIPSEPRCRQLTGVLTGRDGAVTGLTGLTGLTEVDGVLTGVDRVDGVDGHPDGDPDGDPDGGS